MIGRLLILCLIFLVQIGAARRRCINSGVLFPEKVLRSPIVIYGESLGKRVYSDSDAELLFNVTFRVKCILKGPAIETRIEITDAGIKAGHTACQWLDPGQSYVVFLEKWGAHANGYRPLDFQERMVDAVTDDILEKTCGLTSVAPLYATDNSCPVVSNMTFCPHDDNDMSVFPQGEGTIDVNTRVKSSYFDHGSLFQLQSNITVPRQASILSNIIDTKRNAAGASTVAAILLSIVPSLLTMLF